MKLTIGMASFNNFQEVWFTIQALRMYQDLTDTEILVIDNYGDDGLKEFIESWMHPWCRYARFVEKQGTAAPRDRIFQEAKGEWVMVIDSHVMLPPGAVARFRQWAEDHIDCTDLLQGPMLYDDQRHMADAFNDEWAGQMWGTWRLADVTDEAEPYEIPMMGLGLFACRKDAWLGFNQDFKGFGGEEGYIHEKYRLAGRKTLCLPFLKWLHYFHTRNGKVTSPYAPLLEDKIHNYEVGFAELGLDPGPMKRHFGIEKETPKIRNVQIDTNAHCGSSCWFCPVRYIARPPGQIMPQDLFERILDGIAETVRIGSVASDWTLWLSSYNDILLDPLLEERLKALRDRGLRFSCLTNAVGLWKHVDLIHEYRDVIAGYSVNLPAGERQSYSDHTGNPRRMFDRIVASLIALYGRDPVHYSAVVSICINGAFDSQAGLTYEIPQGDTDKQHKDLAALLPMYQVHAMRPLADRAGHLKPFALNNGINRENVTGCNCNGNRLIEWAHINSFGQLYTCCQDYLEETIYADLREMTFHQAVRTPHQEAIGLARGKHCRQCVFSHGG